MGATVATAGGGGWLSQALGSKRRGGMSLTFLDPRALTIPPQVVRWSMGHRMVSPDLLPGARGEGVSSSSRYVHGSPCS